MKISQVENAKGHMPCQGKATGIRITLGEFDVGGRVLPISVISSVFL